jgi:hypothetical protein
MHLDDIPKTAIIAPFGLFEFLWLTFGQHVTAEGRILLQEKLAAIQGYPKPATVTRKNKITLIFFTRHKIFFLKKPSAFIQKVLI